MDLFIRLPTISYVPQILYNCLCAFLIISASLKYSPASFTICILAIWQSSYRSEATGHFSCRALNIIRFLKSWYLWLVAKTIEKRIWNLKIHYLWDANPFPYIDGNIFIAWIAIITVTATLPMSENWIVLLRHSFER